MKPLVATALRPSLALTRLKLKNSDFWLLVEPFRTMDQLRMIWSWMDAISYGRPHMGRDQPMERFLVPIVAPCSRKPQFHLRIQQFGLRCAA